MRIPAFEKFVKKSYSGRLITFDPGQTTGYSIWDNQKLVERGQLNTYDVRLSVKWLNEWLRYNLPTDVSDEERTWLKSHGKEVLSNQPRENLHVRIEEYRVYGHKTESHAQDDMHTSRLIGCFEALLTLQGITYSMCGAGLAKNFATDEKLKAWSMWATGQKHARDAIRHGIYFYCTPGDVT